MAGDPAVATRRMVMGAAEPLDPCLDDRLGAWVGRNRPAVAVALNRCFRLLWQTAVIKPSTDAASQMYQHADPI
jgi:hypothetical protein